MGDDSPDMVIAKRLLDYAKLRGSEFQRVAPGEDGPLVGNRVNGGWVDIVHIEGFSRDCLALRQRTSSLIVPGDALVERRVEGSVLNVLNEVLTWETGSWFAHVPTPDESKRLQLSAVTPVPSAGVPNWVTIGERTGGRARTLEVLLPAGLPRWRRWHLTLPARRYRRCG